MSLSFDNRETWEIAESAVDTLLLFARQWDEASAEDVVQTALVRLLRLIESETAEKPDNVLGWLYAVVRNESINRFRGRRSERKRDQNYAYSQRPWFEPDHESRLDAESVVANLKKLPEETREVIVAKIWGGLSFEGIAELTGTSKSSAHRKYAEGLALLRKMVQK